MVNIDPQIRSKGSPRGAAGVHVPQHEGESLMAPLGHPPIRNADLMNHLHGRVGLYLLERRFNKDISGKTGNTDLLYRISGSAKFSNKSINNYYH